MARNLKLTLTPAAEKAVRGGHPWIFADRIKTQNREGKTGELAVIYDRRDRFLAVGLYDASSPIRVRVLSSEQGVKIDDAWFLQQLATSVAKRQVLIQDSETTGYRCVNGESDGLPGMVVDRYDSVGVVKIYTAAWLPYLANGQLLQWLLQSCSGTSTWVLRLSRNIQTAASALNHHDGEILTGDSAAAEVTHFLENGATLEAEPVRGQKTGFFLDQRDNRFRIRELSRDADILNVFSHTGGFSIHAAIGGARSATDLDISKHALAAARRNMQLNAADPRVQACRHETVQADAFEWLADAGRQSTKQRDSPRYDLIIIDPPSLAKRKTESGRAIDAYQKLAKNGLLLLRKGGVLVTASCSAHVPAETFFKVIRDVTRRHSHRGRELFTSRHAIDHPTMIPEAHYLKCLCWKLDE
ncbi:MAG: 23S rRNA (cytosine1962-C5)-methyltransferase [Verrucomicrobiales bacterium]|jgi:23S rRNA (cytosine1962-C5)-methyltransferase